MAQFSALNTEQQIESLTELAIQALEQFGIVSPELENINHEYNSTFAVTDAQGTKTALRISVNSGRTPENIAAEMFFIGHLSKKQGIIVAKPIANLAGEFVTSIWHEPSQRNLHCVLFTWLEGEELGDEPTVEQVYELGALMARMHDATVEVQLPSTAQLPILNDFMWSVEDFLLASKSELSQEEKKQITNAKIKVESVIAELYAATDAQLIHADLHGWNVMWNAGKIAVFDFDDSGIGLAVQDLATTIYYLDTEEQDAALKAGYASVRPLPSFTEYQMKALLLQRRIHLLNYLYETQNPEHREMLPDYQAETMRRIEVFLNN